MLLSLILISITVLKNLINTWNLNNIITIVNFGDDFLYFLNKYNVRCDIRTYAPFRESELKSNALDRSVNLTALFKICTLLLSYMRG